MNQGEAVKGKCRTGLTTLKPEKMVLERSPRNERRPMLLLVTTVLIAVQNLVHSSMIFPFAW